MRTLSLAFALVLFCVIGSPSRPVAADDQCFNATNRCISGRFATYWSENGGLPVFGFPVTTATYEVNPDTGESYLTQWFERNRFELHPEKAAPYDVLLGRLGNDRLIQERRDWKALPKAAAGQAHFFDQTGHAIDHAPFWTYWSSHGLHFSGQATPTYAESLALFGLPLTEPQMETNSSGDTVLTQWFERARFEDHGDKGILLGLLGNEIPAGYTPVVTAPPPVPSPTPTYSCHPSYPTVCIPPPPPLLTCADIPYRNFPVIGLDPHHFDVDGSGIGCKQ